MDPPSRRGIGGRERTSAGAGEAGEETRDARPVPRPRTHRAAPPEGLAGTAQASAGAFLKPDLSTSGSAKARSRLDIPAPGPLQDRPLRSRERTDDDQAPLP